MTGLPFPELFRGHDAGAYTLPAELLAARDTFVKVAAMPFPTPPRNAWETVQDVAVATVDAVHHGTQLPDPAQIEAARAAERVHQDVLDMMDLCMRTAAGRVTTALHVDEVILDHLAPAHDETWQTFKDAHRVLVEHGETEHRRLLTAPTKVRKAADTVDQAVERYILVRAGRSALTTRMPCPDDPAGKYAAVRNYHEMHPTRMAMVRTAWHGLDSRRFLAWMADHGGQLWMPTTAQQAQAVQDEAHVASPRLPVSRVAT